MDAFLSHSSRNRALANRLEQALQARGLDVWLDDSDLASGVLLRKELQARIGESKAVVLLWSKPASRSRWVNAEWLTTFHLDRFIVPRVLDETPPPQCLQNTAYRPLKRITKRDVDELGRAIERAPASANELAPVLRAESPELHAAIAEINEGQHEMLGLLAVRRLDDASRIQRDLDDRMAVARARWALDPMVVTLDGYHLKNAYMLRHWDAIQAGRAPADPLLEQAEGRFFETLSLDPTDPWPLNGLGSILLFQRELDAAEFFVRAAIAAARSRGMDGYPDAEEDLALIEYYQGG